MFRFSELRGTLQVSPSMYAVIMLALLVPVIILVISEMKPKDRKGPLGTRNVGLQSRSNLCDQYDQKYSKSAEPGKDSQGQPRWLVKALFISPIKSCALFEVGNWTIISTGMKHDRRFAFARKVEKDESSKDAPDWQFMTQRAYPRLALVRPELWLPDESLDTYKPERDYVKTGGCLVVSFPWRPQGSYKSEGLGYFLASLSAKFWSLNIFAEPRIYFWVPLKPTEDMIEKYRLTTHTMKIWKDTPKSLDMKGVINQDALEQLRVFLEVKEEDFTLFSVYREREVYKNAPKKEDLGWQVTQGFTDAYPLHFNNLASIQHVSTRVPKELQPLSAYRFRSNIYITGPEAYDEDSWTTMRIGDRKFIVTNRTTRCNLPNVDPENGVAKKPKEPLYYEPYKSMKDFRCIDEGTPDAVCLGMQMVPAETTEQQIRIGDEVEVVERGKHFKIK